MATAPNFSQPAIFSEVSTPTAPASGFLKVYGKAGALCSIANGGSEKTYAASSDLSSYLPLAGGTLSGRLDSFANVNISYGWGASKGLSGYGSGIASIAGGSWTFYVMPGYVSLAANAHLGWTALAGDSTTPVDLSLYRGAADTLEQRRGTNAQTFRLAETWTSSTSFGAFQIKANAGAAYQIGSVVGSAGGTNRDLSFGQWSAAGTFSNLLNISGASGGSTIRIATTSSAGTCGLEFGSTLSGWQMGQLRVVYDGLGGWGTRLDVSLNRGGGPSDTTATLLSLSNIGNLSLSQAIAGGGSPTAFTITEAAHTTLAASTEATAVNFNLSSTKQFANGAITTQRAFRIQAPVYSHVSGSNTITTASTVAISGAPTTTGGFTTITNAYALNVESGGSNFGGNLRVSSGGLSVLGGELYIHQGLFIQDAVINFNGSRIRSGAGWGAMGDLSLSFENNSSTQIFRVDTGNYIQCSNNAHLRFSSNGSNGDLCLYRDAANIFAQRNSTNAQTFRLYGTHTSSTSYELINIKGKSAANFEIGPENGSAGGTLRGLTLGGYTAGSGTITPWLTFDNTGIATFNTGNLTLTSNGTGLTIQNGHLWMDSWGTHSGLRSRRANGTIGSPTQILNGNLMGFYSVIGWHSGGAYHSTHAGFIGFYATENYTSTAQGCRMVLATTPNGTTTNTTALEISQSGVCTFSKLVGQASAEITSTPSGTTQTITLNNGNHQTLTLTSSTGSVTATLTVPSNVSSGTIIVKQHASTPRAITWAVSSGTIRWMGTQPTWASDATNAVRIVSWRWDGSVMYLAATDVGI